MILTIPVLLYQLFFVLVLYIASRFGRTTLNVATILCLLWTATRLFLAPLAVLQTVVVLGSHAIFCRRSVTLNPRDPAEDRNQSARAKRNGSPSKRWLNYLRPV